MNQFIRAEIKTMADMLREGTFSIPWHQRLYAWNEEHVQVLLDDLAEAMKEKLPCHFLGSVMLIEKKNNLWEINDGQQRIITYSLICSSLCSKFALAGYQQQEGDILRLLFNIKEGHGRLLSDTEHMELSPRLKMPESNAQNFYNLICGKEVGTNGKMVSAWKIINDFLDENDSTEWQLEFTKFLLNQVMIVRLIVDKSLDINAIFETLNDRGKSLSQADLIKNYLLSCFQDEPNIERTKHINNSINRIYMQFNYNMDNISEYIRCHLQIMNRFINAKRLFKTTKKIFSNMNPNERGNNVFNLVDSMSANKNINMFKIFLRKGVNEDFLNQLTTDAGKTNNSRKIEHYLSDLRSYTITRPITYALFCRYNKQANKQTAKFVYSCIKILSSFVQRIAHTQGTFRPSDYEENFANLAHAIFSNECNTTKDFFEEIKNCDIVGIIDTKKYIDLMSSMFYQTKVTDKLKYILRRIAEHQEKGVKVIEGQDSVEHILPKSKDHQKEWGFSSDQCTKLVHCLGNLTLLYKNENSPKKEDNKNFLAKKKIYANSKFLMTQKLCDEEKWEAENIAKRQNKLAKIAGNEIWNFDY